MKAETAPIEELVNRIEKCENVAPEAEQYFIDWIAEESKAWGKMRVVASLDFCRL